MRTDSRPVRPWSFFGLTYLLSWSVWIPLLLAKYDIWTIVSDELSALLRLVGVVMPAVAAIVLTARSGKGSVRRLLARLGMWRVGWRWWLLATVAQPALVIVVALLWNLAGGSPAISAAAIGSAAALAVNIVFLLIAAAGEEIGWRGVALPALQQRRSPLWASGVLAAGWATWHIPFWLLLDTYDQFGVSYLLLSFLFVVPGTLYITWFYNGSGGSLLLPVAFHLTYNVVNVSLLPVTMNVGAFGLLIAFELLIAAAIAPRLRGSGDTGQLLRPAPNHHQRHERRLQRL